MSQFLKFVLFFIFIFSGCSQQKFHQFELLQKDQTNLDFENVLNQTADFNYFNYMYFYNGGGVACGDFNHDGLPDLFFTSNMGPNKLFLNDGALKFTDVSKEANIEGLGGWTSGVTLVDINNDNLLDLYVSQVGEYSTIRGRNQLYVCKGIENGIPHYEDEALQYGLGLVGFSTQAAFFDADLDGDLDMFQLNHSLHQNGTFGQKKDFEGTLHPLAGDKLLRNDGGRFVDITSESGIKSTVIGYGLGVGISDVNLDGWPDIYVGNDFHEDDYLYINQTDGTFKEVGQQQMKHTSRFSMGVDIADINNDALSDVISLDMMPDDPEILKRSQGENTLDVYNFKLGYGYGYQYARNNLQLNQGNNQFTEIGMFAGIHATDWSWAPLLVDFNNNGNKDIFISNGIPRRMNDLDYINFRADHEIRFKANTNNVEDEDLVLLEKMPRIHLPNRFFQNTGQLSFDDIGDEVKGNVPSYSNGAVYADLDQDGDLEIIVNNIESGPFIYKNLTREQDPGNANYIHIRLNGPEKNIFAIGARAIIFKEGEKLVCENFPARGFQSCISPQLFIGLGDTSAIDSIHIIWPDRTYEKFTKLNYNTSITIDWREGLPEYPFANLSSRDDGVFSFTDITSTTGIDFTHEENEYLDFNRELLIPHMVSSDGPALAIGDINKDGLDDFFIGSSKRRFSRLYMQNQDATFSDVTPDIMLQDSTYEDVDAVFIDIENDGDQDLVVASGGNEFWGDHEALLQRVYINDGNANFSVDKKMFGETHLTASCVLPCDFNQDGLVDLFFGARAVPWKYGQTPTSFLFKNEGGGEFKDVTKQVSEELAVSGMVKHGAWNDIDGDGDMDLILAIEWQPIQIYLNENDRFIKYEVGSWKGWWNFVLPHDFDQDGDIDFIAGNTGKNSKLKPNVDQPLRLYINDYDDNGQIEQILTYYNSGREIPFATYEELTKQMPPLKKRFLFAKDLASASIEDLLGKEKIAVSEILDVNTLESAYFENTGSNLEFVKHPLSDELQLTTLNTGLLLDIDDDGYQEILLGENFYGNNVELGRSDAGTGHILKILEGPNYMVNSVGELSIDGQVRRQRIINIAGESCVMIAKNDGRLQVIQLASKNPNLVQ